MQKLLIGLLSASALLAGICGCGGRGAANEIRIGVIAELTGDIPAVGTSCKNAAVYAVEEINAAGGLTVAGIRCPVKMILEDNAGKADQSAATAQKLITQQNVVAIVGPNASRYAIPASEIAESSKVVLITPWSTNPKTTVDARTGAPKRYVFRACYSDTFQGRVLAKFALNGLGARRAAALFDIASDANKGVADIFKETFEANGGQVVSYETYTTGDKDYSAQLTKIKNANPDIVFLPNYYNEVPLQVQQAHRLGLVGMPFLGNDAWSSEELLKLCGSDCNDYFFSCHYASDTTDPTARKFIDGYRAKYGVPPDDIAALTYDAFGLLFTALRDAGKTSDREAVREAMARISEFNGGTGKMRFEGTGDPIKSTVIQQIRNGQFLWYTNAVP